MPVKRPNLCPRIVDPNCWPVIFNVNNGTDFQKTKIDVWLRTPKLKR
jgi:hypothetical protein